MPARTVELQHDILPNTRRAPDFDHAVGFGELQRRDRQAAVGIDHDLRVLHKARNVQRESFRDVGGRFFQTVAVQPHQVDPA